jgi:hypothetical protein
MGTIYQGRTKRTFTQTEVPADKDEIFWHEVVLEDLLILVVQKALGAWLTDTSTAALTTLSGKILSETCINVVGTSFNSPRYQTGVHGVHDEAVDQRVRPIKGLLCGVMGQISTHTFCILSSFCEGSTTETRP